MKRSKPPEDYIVVEKVAIVGQMLMLLHLSNLIEEFTGMKGEKVLDQSGNLAIKMAMKMSEDEIEEIIQKILKQ